MPPDPTDVREVLSRRRAADDRSHLQALSRRCPASPASSLQRGHTGNRRGCCCPRPVSAYGAELVQQGQEVDGLPVLGEPAAGDTVEVDRGDRDGPPGGRHAGEQAAVGALRPPAGRDLVPLGDLVQHGDGKVGEGPPGGHDRVAVGAGADAAAVGQPAPEVGREQVVERRDVAVGEDLFVVAATSALCSAWVMSPPSPAAYTIVEVMMVRVTSQTYWW